MNGGYVVVPAGNEDPDVPITEFPALYKTGGRPTKFQMKGIDNMIVVGEVAFTTMQNFFQTASFVKLFAPATHLWNVVDEKEKLHGTSFGLLATLLSRDVENPIQKMEEWAYPRVPGGPNVIWNGITRDKWSGGSEHKPGDSGESKRPFGDGDPGSSSGARRRKVCCILRFRDTTYKVKELLGNRGSGEMFEWEFNWTYYYKPLS
ncbi:hypothetical protein TWF281_005373 [Arthrobotrys megalospora]